MLKEEPAPNNGGLPESMDTNDAAAADADAATPVSKSEYEDTEEFKRLTGLGFVAMVADVFAPMFISGKMSFDDLEERTLESLKALKPEHARVILEKFRDANLIGVQNQAAFLGSCMKNFKERVRQMGIDAALSGPFLKGPDPEKLQALLDRTEYPLEVTIGQRKYGPPSEATTVTAPNGAEVYCGKIPNEMYEDDLVPLFEQAGRIFDLRLMMDPLTSQNRGYAFITFFEKSNATAAAEKFDGYEVSPGRKLKCNVSIANTRLFVGNIPKTKSKDEISEEFGKLTDGIQDIIVYASPDDGDKRNRGFCFVQYEDHKGASQAKRKLSSAKIRPFNRDIVVDWAEELDEPDDDTMTKVKVLYVKNLKAEITEEGLQKEFEPYGTIEKVKRQKDYAFVHFNEREDAIKAMEALNGKEFDGLKCDITLAKPQIDKKKKQQRIMQRQQRQAPMWFSMMDQRGGPPPRGGRGGRGRGRGGYGDFYGGGFGFDDFAYGGGFGGGPGGDFGYGYDEFGYGYDMSYGAGGGYGGYGDAGFGFAGGWGMPAPPYGGGRGGPRGMGRGRGFAGPGRGFNNRGGPRGAATLGQKRKAGEEGGLSDDAKRPNQAGANAQPMDSTPAQSLNFAEDTI